MTKLADVSFSINCIERSSKISSTHYASIFAGSQIKMKITSVTTLLGNFIVLAVEANSIFDSIPNNIIFEKMEYQILNKTLIKNGVVKWKKVRYNTVVFNASMTLTEPLNEIWVHSVLYYKYRQYQKYLIDIWVEYCRSIADPSSHPIINIVLNNFFALREHFFINFDLKCPLSGEIEFRTIRSFNVSKIIIPLMQAGRYRANFYYTLHQNGPVYAAGQVYFSISDIRVWF